jgi:hypothetical protein
LSFDIYEPKKYVSLSADGSGMEEIPLTVSIWDSNRFADDLLGEVTLSILDFMEMEDSDHYGVLNSNRSVDWWPLTFATKNGVIPAGEMRLQVGWRKGGGGTEETEGYLSVACTDTPFVFAFVVRSLCVRCAFVVRSLCVRCAFVVRSLCVLCVPWRSLPSLPVLCVFFACSLRVPACSLPVLYLFFTCYLPAIYLLP